MSSILPEKVREQMARAGLPTGQHPFIPQLTRNRNGDLIIEKRTVLTGPKAGKKGFVDDQGRIWVKDRAHGGLPDHWDVQVDDGTDYFRIDEQDDLLP